MVCVANYAINSDGVHIQQRDFGANDGYYRDEWYIVKLNQNDEVIKNIQKLHNIAREYYPASDDLAIRYTLQFIRRIQYYDSLFFWAAGSIDQDFVEYVKNKDNYLYEYFSNYNVQEGFYYTTPDGDKIDIPHFAATYAVYQYNSLGEFADILIEEKSR